MSRGRLKRVANYLTDDDAFCFTYGDSVGDIDITQIDRPPPSPGYAASKETLSDGRTIIL